MKYWHVGGRTVSLTEIINEYHLRIYGLEKKVNALVWAIVTLTLSVGVLILGEWVKW
jgi:hypothetical protein